MNDVIGESQGHEYVVLDFFGAGTFGQVLKCKKNDPHDQLTYAVKVIKSKRVYVMQALQENEILDTVRIVCM